MRLIFTERRSSLWRLFVIMVAAWGWVILLWLGLKELV
jgi:hypothetical protein